MVKINCLVENSGPRELAEKTNELRESRLLGNSATEEECSTTEHESSGRSILELLSGRGGNLRPDALVVVYGTPFDSYCMNVRKWLDEKGVPYVDIDISASSEKEREMRDLTGKTTVPQIMINHELIGGYEHFKSLEKSGELDQKLKIYGRPKERSTILLYSSPVDLYSTKLKMYFSQKNVHFASINVFEELENRKQMVERTGHLKPPQVLIRMKHLGGYNEIMALEESGEMDRILFAENENSISKVRILPKILRWEKNLFSFQDRVIEHGKVSSEERQVKALRPDDLEFFAVQLRSFLAQDQSLGKQKVGFTTYEQCVSGRTIVSGIGKFFIQCRKPVIAMAAAHMLFQAKLLHSINNQGFFEEKEEAFYRFEIDSYSSALNQFRTVDKSFLGGLTSDDLLRQVNERITKLFSSLLFQDATSELSDCARVAGSYEFKEYLYVTLKLQHFDMNILKTDDEKKSFYVNIFNSLALHAIILHGKPKDYKQQKGLVEKMAYNIGGNKYTLNEIYHGLLRQNSKLPGNFSFLQSGLVFPSGERDPRARYKVEKLDARIHFALSSGCISSPLLKFYSSENLGNALDLATSGYLDIEENFQVESDKAVIYLPKIFEWYKHDFGDSTKLRTFLLKYVSPKHRKAVSNITTFKVNYRAFNWSFRDM